MRKIEIKIKNGRWLVNEKNYSESSYKEKVFLCEFFKSIKLQEIIKPKIYPTTSCSFNLPTAGTKGVFLKDPDFFDKPLSEINVSNG